MTWNEFYVYSQRRIYLESRRKTERALPSKSGPSPPIISDLVQEEAFKPPRSGVKPRSRPLIRPIRYDPLNGWLVNSQIGFMTPLIVRIKLCKGDKLGY